MGTNNLPIGKQIRIVRTVQDQRQRVLAEACAVHVTYISLMENGKMLPTPEQVAAIEGVLKVRFNSPEVRRALQVLLGSNGRESI